MVAVHNVAAAEALSLARRVGLDPAEVLPVLADGAGTSRMLELRGPLMVAGDYGDAAMRVELWLKDVGLIGAFAREHGAPTPLFDAAAPLYHAALAQGRGAQDTASVFAVLDQEQAVKGLEQQRQKE
ncbi:MAG TPA: NAD-binding protein [Actinomycetota bacterium]